METGLSEEQAGAAEAAQRRRRKRRSSRHDEQEGTDWLAVLRSRGLARAVFVAVALLASGRTWQEYRLVDQSVGTLGNLQLGMDAAAASKALGGQPVISGRIVTVRDGQSLEVAIDPASGKVASITCHEEDLTSLPCPAILGIRIGDHPKRVVQLLGPSAAAEGQAATLSYPGLAMQFDVEQERIARVRIAGPAQETGIWPIVRWRLLP